ncbi:MAG: PKD domain-containing protein, partial [Candidatus Omnitrophota bacterium]|nr:PKD domain-containing protein [Candidatus Omnitrophota bacterium]
MYIWAFIQGSVIQAAYSHDQGASWSTPVDAGFGLWAQDYRIACVGSYVYMVWWTNYYDGAKIRFTSSSDYGVTWLPGPSIKTIATYISSDPAKMSHPEIACDDSGKVYLAWANAPYGKRDIYFNYSQDNGSSWLPSALRLDAGNQGAADSELCAINASGNGKSYVVWRDDRNGSGDIYFAVPQPTAGFTASPVTGYAPLLVNFIDISIGTVTNYAWDFGDGSGTSTEQNPAHTYTLAGVYPVTLTVTGLDAIDAKTKTYYVAAGDTAPYVLTYSVPEVNRSIEIRDGRNIDGDGYFWLKITNPATGELIGEHRLASHIYDYASIGDHIKVQFSYDKKKMVITEASAGIQYLTYPDTCVNYIVNTENGQISTIHSFDPYWRTWPYTWV